MKPGWLSLLQLIFKYGSLTIPSYDYQRFRRSELKNISHLVHEEEDSEKSNFNPVKYLLNLPLLGPLIASASYYKTQKRWPTYVYHWPQRKLAYVRISKSACTSVQEALLCGRFRSEDVRGLNVNQINYLGMKYIQPGLMPGYTCFTVVRDPVDRLISCYHDKCEPRNKDFYYYQDYLFGIIKPNLSIDQFVRSISKIPDFLKDIHFRPQSNFLEGLTGVKIFKLEDNNQKLNAFLNSYNLSLRHRHQNAAKKLTANDLKPETKELLKVIYRKDFQNFDYPANF